MIINFLLVHPTHYFEFLLQNLNETVKGEHKIRAYFLEEVNTLYPWKSNFRNGFESEVMDGSFLKLKLFKHLYQEKNSTNILVGWDRLDKIILILFFSLFKRKYLIYTDTPNTYKERPFILEKLRNLVLYLISKTSLGIITTGEIGIEKIKTWNFKFKNIINLPFYVDNDLFKPNNKNIEPDSKITFFSSGRLLNSHKGYDVILNALGYLKKENEIGDFKYLIAGEGSDREQIESLIQSLDLTKEVELLGWIEPTQLIALYQKSTIFIHPSRFDPYPNAILEAMACGAAIIASDRAGSAIDRIENWKNGVLFESGNRSSLEITLKTLLKPETDLTSIRYNARRTAMEWPISRGIETIKKISTIK